PPHSLRRRLLNPPLPRVFCKSPKYGTRIEPGGLFVHVHMPRVANKSSKQWFVVGGDADL
ncbi:hypothetical protein, partial [Thauera chlorobenzoica]|uniref:hypothetical protein n=1 Tax=Thauera chlorobenzoica TaxID=96773 RepID=UPI001F16756A